ncbi:MAG: PorT family protein [Bacteroidales bacterium]|jgi:hypothetical protein|nr:PorT family protein [Bacteroidales bacterium]MCI1784719.1 PorT family protein [Bacteroidales bacterium]
MLKDDNREFDKRIKSIMENAREEVPDRVWNAVSYRLDNMQPNRKHSFRWKRLVSAVSLAAAITAGIVASIQLTDHKDIGQRNNGLISVIADTSAGKDSEVNGNLIAAVTGTTEKDKKIQAIKEEIVINSDKPDKSEAEGGSEVKTGGGTGNKIAEEHNGTSIKSTPSVKSKSRQAKEDERDNENESEEYLQDPFTETEYQEDEDKQSSGISGITFVVNGQLESNGSPNSNSRTGPLRTGTQTAPTKTTIKELSESTYGVPLSFGLGVRIKYKKRWALNTGIEYSFLSRAFTGTYTKVDSRGIIIRTITADISNRQHFIGIPLNISYNIVNGKAVCMYAFGGGTAEKCFLDNYRIKSQPEKINFRQSVDGVQLSAACGIGVQFKLDNGLNLYIDPSLRYYFDCDQPKSIRTQQPLMINFEAGLRIDL